MKSTEDSSERLGKEQAERRESRFNKIESLVRRNTRRFLVAGLLTIIPSVLALVSGIGFTATVKVASYQLLIRGHRCPGVPVVDCQYATSSCACLEGFEYEGIMNVTFNPYLYPINHFSGSPVSTDFTLRVKPSVSKASFKESLITQTILSEFPINIPLFYTGSFVLATALEKMIRKG